jgi:hypothetical protein
VGEEARQSGEDELLREYYEVFQSVNEFDKRLLTVKGWGVTLSLAALAWGFQYAHYGLFLVAALSGFAFWLIEGVMKRHQMRYYLRMREIEVLQYKHAPSENARALTSPRIDSSWSHAGWLYSGKDKEFSYPPTEIKGPRNSYRLAWFFPHVCLPHVVSVVVGLALLWLGIYGALGDKMQW